MNRDLAHEAVKYMLDQIQENPDVRYYCGPGTQMFWLLVQAEAAHVGQPVEEVERARRRDTQPSYRRREPEAVRLREERDQARRACERNGVNWSAEE